MSSLETEMSVRAKTERTNIMDQIATSHSPDLTQGGMGKNKGI